MTGREGLDVRVERSIEALGGAWDPVFAAGTGLQTSRAWFATSASTALPLGSQARFVAVQGAGGPLALFPMRADVDGGWGSLTTPYSCVYQPLYHPEAAPARLAAAVAAFGRYCRNWPVTRLEALDPAWPGLAVLRAGLQAAGSITREFDHFANWHTPVPGPSWEAYLSARPGALRETIRRKMRAADRAGDVRIEIARAGADLPAALAAYEAVYARSWKEPEPFPGFNEALVRALAGSRTLRIAVMWRSDIPIAAQYWTVVDGCGTVLKLAHDEVHKALSPGTVLTAAAIKDLIETDGIVSLDFGRGDDPYKRSWAGERRMRIGLLALDVKRAAGVAAWARHDGGRAWRSVTSRWAARRRTTPGAMLW